LSTLELIRHGQASFGAADYDVLSEIGVRQAVLLGEHFAATGQRCDAFFSGPRKRQIDTARHLAQSAAGAVKFPELQIIDELDEYPAFELAKYSIPSLVEIDDEVKAIAADGLPHREGRMFEAMILRWLDGRLECGPHETFAAFDMRVRRGLAKMTTHAGKGITVVAVTSGGPISIALAAALDLGARAILKLQSSTYNASVSQLKYRGNELKLTAFNGVPHLVGKAPITLR
jgi:broad specificity phosphatase PhoE